jgi:hypothetical protein
VAFALREGAHAAVTGAAIPAASVAAMTLRFSRALARGTTRTRPVAYPTIVALGIKPERAPEVPNDTPNRWTSGCDAKSGCTMIPAATAKSRASGRVISAGAGS